MIDNFWGDKRGANSPTHLKNIIGDNLIELV